jgi:hemerythrin-like domain-containing protein
MAGNDELEPQILVILKQDHDHLRALLCEISRAYENGDAGTVRRLFDEFLGALKLHTLLEEEIVYSAARKAIDTPDLIDEALAHHDRVARILGSLDSMDPRSFAYGTTLESFANHMRSHLHLEEGVLFRQLRRSGLDLEQLAARVQARRSELQALSHSG